MDVYDPSCDAIVTRPSRDLSRMNKVKSNVSIDVSIDV